MQNSGTKLVLTLVVGALLLGSVSWWYRYEAAHRASQFWGPGASSLIAESEQFDALVFEPCTADKLGDLRSDAFGRVISLHDARGQAHLRHAILGDRNYLWDDPRDPNTTKWRVCLRFGEAGSRAFVLFSEAFEAIGKYDVETQEVVGFACVPMAGSLNQYFGPLDEPPADASTSAE